MCCPYQTFTLLHPLFFTLHNIYIFFFHVSPCPILLSCCILHCFPWHILNCQGGKAFNVLVLLSLVRISAGPLLQISHFMLPQRAVGNRKKKSILLLSLCHLSTQTPPRVAFENIWKNKSEI